jgi:hypothetical protein
MQPRRRFGAAGDRQERDPPDSIGGRLSVLARTLTATGGKRLQASSAQRFHISNIDLARK